MPDSSKQTSKGDKTRTAESSVWVRLREQMERLNSVQPAESDPKGLAERLATRAKLLRQRMERPRAEETRITFLAFNKQQERYGIPLDEVAAVESLDHFTPVPGAADFIRGVTPWRGSILSLIDLGLLFGRPESGISDLRVCIIVETAGRRLAVVAHEVEEIISVSAGQLPAAPDLPVKISPDWIIGVHDENRLILRMHEIVQDEQIAAWKK